MVLKTIGEFTIKTISYTILKVFFINFEGRVFLFFVVFL